MAALEPWTCPCRGNGNISADWEFEGPAGGEEASGFDSRVGDGDLEDEPARAKSATRVSSSLASHFWFFSRSANDSVIVPFPRCNAERDYLLVGGASESLLPFHILQNLLLHLIQHRR